MFQLHMLGAVAQLERSLIRERQRQRIVIARTKRTCKGRMPVLNAEQIAQARASVVLKVPKAQIARVTGVSRSALYDALADRGAYAAGPTPAGSARPTLSSAGPARATAPDAVPAVIHDSGAEAAGASDATPVAPGPGELGRELPSPAT